MGGAVERTNRVFLTNTSFAITIGEATKSFSEPSRLNRRSIFSFSLGLPTADNDKASTASIHLRALLITQPVGLTKAIYNTMVLSFSVSSMVRADSAPNPSKLTQVSDMSREAAENLAPREVEQARFT
jgi:hypothetical protein